VKCLIITVTIGATGIVTKGVKKQLEATSIPGIQSIDPLQKTAIRGTSHNVESIAV
jgi:hypothetical protein